MIISTSITRVAAKCYRLVTHHTNHIEVLDFDTMRGAVEWQRSYAAICDDVDAACPTCGSSIVVCDHLREQPGTHSHRAHHEKEPSNG